MFRIKPATAGVPLATSLHVDSYSGHFNHFTRNKLNLSQLSTLSFADTWADLLKAWLALTSVKYHDNLLILMLLNQWLALTML